MLFAAGDYLVVQNEGSHLYTDFSMSVQHLHYVVFKVKACTSVYVLLGATFNNDHKVNYPKKCWFEIFIFVSVDKG